MSTVSVYYDYLCPFCYRGIVDLLDLLPVFPEIQVEWIPCEAHPRPEEMKIYSDIANQAFYSIENQKADVQKYHLLVFEAVFQKRERIDDIDLLCRFAADCKADPEITRQDLEQKKYEKQVNGNNRDVWVTEGFEAVPDYRMGFNVLASKPGELISQQELLRFLEEV